MLEPEEQAEHWRDAGALEDSYDVVIVGGGLPGVALAYYLATSHSVSNVAVLAKGSLFGPPNASPYALVSPQPWWPFGAEFGLRSSPLFEQLQAETDGPELLTERDRVVIARNNDELNSCRWRTELSKAHGTDAPILDATAVRKLLPGVGSANTPSIVGGQVIPRGGVLRVDRAIAAYASGAHEAGVRLAEGTPVVDVEVENGRVRGIRTTAGLVRAPVVVVCAPGSSSLVAQMAGVALPLLTRRHESMLTESTDVDIEVVAGFESDDIVVAPVDQGRTLVTGVTSHFGTYSSEPSLDALDRLATGALAVLPDLAGTRLHRHFRCLIDTTADGRPLIGTTTVEGVLANVGWGAGGTELLPAVVSELAASIARNELSPLLDSLLPSRFDLARPHRLAAS